MITNSRIKELDNRSLRVALVRVKLIGFSRRWAQSTAVLARLTPPTSLRTAEFKEFSQFLEGGIIQYLVDQVEVASRIFVEIGVQDYSEPNTRFLASNNNWSGAIIDSGVAHRDFV